MRTGKEMLLAEAGVETTEAQDQDSGASPPSPPAAGKGCEAAAGGGVLGSAVGVAAGGGAAAVSAGAGAAAIPMAPHRRLRQAVLLAHKLLKKEGELEVARRELADLQSRCDESMVGRKGEMKGGQAGEWGWETVQGVVNRTQTLVGGLVCSTPSKLQTNAPRRAQSLRHSLEGAGSAIADIS